MADIAPRPGRPKTDVRRAPLPDLQARASLDRARLRARVAGKTTTTPDDGAGEGRDRPARPMPVLRWKDRLGR